MTTFPNQRRVTIISNEEDPNNILLKTNKENWYRAASHLSPSAVKLYIYFALNKNGYEFALSRADVCDKMSMGSSSYTNAVNELLEKQYLIPLGGNKFIFSDAKGLPRGWIGK